MIFSFFKKKKKTDKKDNQRKKADDSRAGIPVTAVATGKTDESLPEILPAKNKPKDNEELKDLVFEYSFEGSTLYMMYKEWYKQQEDDGLEFLKIREFIEKLVSEVANEPEFKQAPSKFGIEFADMIIDFLDEESEYANEDDEKNNDAVVKNSQKNQKESDKKTPHSWIYVTEDKLRAYIVLFPKRNNSYVPTNDRIKSELEALGITDSIDAKLLRKITVKKMYFQLFVIARGTDKIDGKDGEVIEHFPRKIKLVLKEDEFGNTDYKNLGNVKNIDKGAVICDIIPPTSGTVGYDIYGKEIPCKDGEMPIIPMGENTNLTDNEKHLVASCDGCVNYHDGMFYVRQLLYIKGNVDPHTGNISFKGDIIVEGDVYEGYTVNADGNLRIQGTVENSSLTAGGGISISGGVKGNEKAILTSGSEIKSLFLENCTVKAKNGVYSESIINSSIYTDDCISVDRGRGIIIGGTLVARNYVQAKTIGNQSGRICTIKLGTNYDLAEEKASLTKELDELEKGLKEIKKDLIFFDRSKTLSSDKKEKYSALKSKAGLYANQIRIKQKKLTDIINNGFDIGECYIKARECFPPINLTIGTHNTIIRMPYFSSKCYFSSHKEEFRIVNANDSGPGNRKKSKKDL